MSNVAFESMKDKRSVLAELNMHQLAAGAAFLSKDGLLDEDTCNNYLKEIENFRKKPDFNNTNLITNIRKIINDLYINDLLNDNGELVLNDNLKDFLPNFSDEKDRIFMRNTKFAREKILDFMWQLYRHKKLYPAAKKFSFTFWSEKKVPDAGTTRSLKATRVNSKKYKIEAFNPFSAFNQQRAQEYNITANMIIQTIKKYNLNPYIQSYSGNDGFEYFLIAFKLDVKQVFITI